MDFAICRIHIAEEGEARAAAHMDSVSSVISVSRPTGALVLQVSSRSCCLDGS